jgi:membrane-associated phospholipid phosphatase
MLIPASVLAAGVAAELLKPLIGRTRPEDAIKPAGSELVYAFMPWSQRLGDWSDLGIPSSHGAVSFAAACAIATLYPRTLIVTVPLAIGTCFTRVVNDNHYLSDTLAGAAIGALCALACARLLPPRGANRP